MGWMKKYFWVSVLSMGNPQFFFLFFCENLNVVHRVHLLTKFPQDSSYSFVEKWLWHPNGQTDGHDESIRVHFLLRNPKNKYHYKTDRASTRTTQNLNCLITLSNVVLAVFQYNTYYIILLLAIYDRFVLSSQSVLCIINWWTRKLDTGKETPPTF